MARIGPRVGVVEVEQHLSARLLHALRQRDRVLQVLGDERVVSAVEVVFKLRIDEQPQAIPVRAVVAEDLDRVARRVCRRRDRSAPLSS